jgi:hypothetical protein
MPHAEVDSRAVGGGTHHQGHHGFRDIYALLPRYRFTLTTPISISTLISVSTFRCLSYDGFVLPSLGMMIISRLFVTSINCNTIIYVSRALVDDLSILNLFEVFRHPTRATVLILSLPQEVVDDIGSQSATGHGVENDIIGDFVANPHDHPI